MRRRQLPAYLAAIAACLPLHAAPTMKFAPVPAGRILDPTHFERRSPEQAEVLIFRPGRLRTGGDLLSFHLNRKPIATFQAGEALRLFLEPGSHRFGVLPTSNPGLYRIAEIIAEVKKVPVDERQIYRVFQSSGFTSSGGNAVFEIRRYIEPPE
jgi:hypothetical protein